MESPAPGGAPVVIMYVFHFCCIKFHLTSEHGVAYRSGPFILGYILNWGLYGVLSTQVYLYYIAFPNDRLYTKALVYGTYTLETLQSILIAHDAFKTFGQGFGNFDVLNSIQFLWLTIPVIGGIATCLVQFFYAYRVSVLSQTKLMATIISVMSIGQWAAAIVAGVLADKGGTLTKLDSAAVRTAQGVWGGLSAACDITIAACMSYELSRRGTGFRSTQAFLIRILRLVVGTGMLTALIDIVNLILFNGISHTAYFIVPGAILGKLYTNSMMVILNSRLEIVGGRHTGQSSSEIMMQPTFRANLQDFPSRRAENEHDDSLPISEGKRPTWDSELGIEENNAKGIQIGVNIQKTVALSPPQ
ncbi:hypothetical protein BDQ12DRAFT_690534 [Crucibulum laeve]|uniref:DUF6534 domain-containing protein n=1 Tax=Crucibulum laeve TaxID=68775 RepID=A0A5C3LM87_9AGAR|nr:hypothetical protein BDQ12DRAFT_690534 [Crucibulum laeve]